MSKAEEFIKKQSHVIENPTSVWISSYNARKAVEIAREELIDKAIGWIREINTHHHIMQYSDSCEPPLSELTEWFKNYMKEENINSK